MRQWNRNETKVTEEYFWATTQAAVSFQIPGNWSLYIAWTPFYIERYLTIHMYIKINSILGTPNSIGAETSGMKLLPKTGSICKHKNSCKSSNVCKWFHILSNTKVITVDDKGNKASGWRNKPCLKLCKIKRASKKYPAAHLDYPAYGL